MELNDFYNQIKESYPEISSKADLIYDRYWGDLGEMSFSPYSWFESLANALNEEMKRGVATEIYEPLFNQVSRKYTSGADEVRQAIDVAFVENLYWQVSANQGAPFWKAMPSNLQKLYIGFHGHPPY